MQGTIGGRRRLPYAIRTGLCFDLVLVSLSLTQEINPINHVMNIPQATSMVLALDILRTWEEYRDVAPIQKR